MAAQIELEDMLDFAKIYFLNVIFGFPGITQTLPFPWDNHDFSLTLRHLVTFLSLLFGLLCVQPLPSLESFLPSPSVLCEGGRNYDTVKVSGEGRP